MSVEQSEKELASNEFKSVEGMHRFRQRLVAVFMVGSMGVGLWVWIRRKVCCSAVGVAFRLADEECDRIQARVGASEIVVGKNPKYFVKNVGGRRKRLFQGRLCRDAPVILSPSVWKKNNARRTRGIEASFIMVHPASIPVGGQNDG